MMIGAHEDKAVVFENLFFGYNGTLVLEDISFSINHGDFVGIIGPNGGGKTTLLKMILGQLTPAKGRIVILNDSPLKVRQHIGYMPQYSTVNTAVPLSVTEIVAMGLFEATSLFPRISAKNREKIAEVLDRLGIASLAASRYRELSGGQKQRTLLARAIVSEPKILLLDEPTASVDYNAEKDIYEYLKILNEQMTVILVSHDVSVVSSLVNRIVCLNRRAAFHAMEELKGEHFGRKLYNTDVDLIHHHCKL